MSEYIDGKEIIEWLISLYPYKYAIDTDGNTYIRNDIDERWERRKAAIMLLYRTNTFQLSNDIWRNIIMYL